MAQIEITVNGRSYLVGCDDGQEMHVARLGRYLDQKVAGLVQSMGQIGDARLAVMAGLLVADELVETNQALGNLRSEFNQANRARGAADAARTEQKETAAGAPNGLSDAAASEEASALADVLDRLTERIQGVTAALEAP